MVAGERPSSRRTVNRKKGIAGPRLVSSSLPDGCLARDDRLDDTESQAADDRANQIPEPADQGHAQRRDRQRRVDARIEGLERIEEHCPEGDQRRGEYPRRRPDGVRADPAGLRENGPVDHGPGEQAEPRPAQEQRERAHRDDGSDDDGDLIAGRGDRADLERPEAVGEDARRLADLEVRQQGFHDCRERYRQADARDHLHDEVGALQAPEYHRPQGEAHNRAEPEDNHKSAEPGRPAVDRNERVKKVGRDIRHRADPEVQDAGHAVGQRDAASEHREDGADHESRIDEDHAFAAFVG